MKRFPSDRSRVYLVARVFNHIFSERLLVSAGYRARASGSVTNAGSNGYYWSAASNSATNAYNLNFNSGNVNPQNNNNRANGFSVRPVRRPQNSMFRHHKPSYR